MALHEYKCPCCGGALEFNTDVQKMKCPYCDTEFEVDAFKAYDDELNSQPEGEMNWQTTPGSEWGEGESDGLHVFVCKSCGGSIVTDENTGATSCPYCGNPVVMTGQFSGDLKPDVVIPFKYNKEKAVDAFKKHLQNKKFLARDFKEANHIEEIQGVYVPFWLFNADAEAQVSYKATRTRSWSDSSYVYQETKYYNVRREGVIGFDNVPVDGSTRMPDDLMESVEPFELKDGTEFKTAYLAGYLADKYDVSAEDSIERANTRIKRSTEQEFLKTVKGYSSVVPEWTNISVKNGDAKYALYPVWVLYTKWKGNDYLFAMNGQTGKFVGNLPIDKGISRRFFFKWTAIASVVTFLITMIPNIIRLMGG